MHPGLFILFFILAFIAFLLLFEWSRSHWKQILKMLKAPHTIRNQPYPFERQNNLDPLPPSLKNVDPDMEQLVRAIYSSVKRYKDQFQSFYQNSYHCSVRSKRYDLRISLTSDSAHKYFLQIILEGKHPHDFRIENFGSFPKFARKNSEISKEEVQPFIKHLSFFNSVEAEPDILSTETIVHSNDSMESWPKALSAFIRLGRYLMDSAVRKEILNAIDVLCPYCRGQFSDKDNTVSCSECKTRHHTECWEEVGRCAVFGCRSKTEIVITMN